MQLVKQNLWQTFWNWLVVEDMCPLSYFVHGLWTCRSAVTAEVNSFRKALNVIFSLHYNKILELNLQLPCSCGYAYKFTAMASCFIKEEVFVCNWSVSSDQSFDKSSFQSLENKLFGLSWGTFWISLVWVGEFKLSLIREALICCEQVHCSLDFAPGSVAVVCLKLSSFPELWASALLSQPLPWHCISRDSSELLRIICPLIWSLLWVHLKFLG